MKSSILVLLLLSSILLPSVLHAQPSNRPLYTDEDNGWMVWSCYSGEEIMQRCPLPGAAAYKHISKRGSWKWYGFSVIVSPGDQVYMSKNTVFTMTYEIDGEVKTVTGEHLLTISFRSGEPMFAKTYGVFIPPSKEMIFTTKMPPEVGHPVLFVYFPLTNQPDFIVRCDVKSTLYKRGGR